MTPTPIQVLAAARNHLNGVRTLGAQMMSSNLSQRDWIGYQDADIHHIAFPYPWVLEGCSGEEFLLRELAC